MNSTFIPTNPALTHHELESAISERLAHIKTIITCLYATTDACIRLDHDTIYDAIHLLYEQSEEIELLKEKQLEN